MKIRITLIAFLVFLVLLVGLMPIRASAQISGAEASGFENVTLWVYPEYDDPRLLTMLEGKITSAPPVEAKFLVPSSAEMYSAGSKDAQGKYSGGPPNRIASDTPNWDEISYQVKTDTFRVEYYDAIITGQTDKQISYDFRFLYPISDLRVIVQQPLKATAFLVSPAGNATFENQFAVQTYSFTNLTPDKPIHFDISYTKSSADPSVQNTPTPLAPLISSGGPSGSTSTNRVPMIILIMTLVILGVFGGILVMAKRSGRTASVRPAANNRPVQRPAGKKFCNQCGKPIEAGSRFCQHCGRKVAGR